MEPIQRLDQFTLPTGFRGRNTVIVQLWWLVQSIFFGTSPQFMYGWRRFLLRVFGARIGKNVLIRPSARITFPWKVDIGDNSWIGDDVILYSLGEIQIGSNVVISQRSYLCTGSHDYRKPSFDIFAAAIQIEDEAWIATDVFIAPGVTIGKGAMIGARSTVFGNMPPAMVCYGSPAKPIKSRCEDTTCAY